MVTPSTVPSQFGTFSVRSGPPPREISWNETVALGGELAEDRIRFAQVGLAVAVPVKGEERVDLLADGTEDFGADVEAVDQQLVVLGALVAPQLLVPDRDRRHAARATADVFLDRGRGKQAYRVVASDERLVVDVERRQARLHERELVALARVGRHRSPRAPAGRAVADRDRCERRRRCPYPVGG